MLDGNDDDKRTSSPLDRLRSLVSAIHQFGQVRFRLGDAPPSLFHEMVISIDKMTIPRKTALGGAAMRCHRRPRREPKSPKSPGTRDPPRMFRIMAITSIEPLGGMCLPIDEIRFRVPHAEVILAAR